MANSLAMSLCSSKSEGAWSPVYHYVTMLLWLMMVCVPPRLLQIGFCYSQPYIIKKAVELAVLPQEQPYNNWAYGLIGAFAIVYTGLAVSSESTLRS